MAIHAHEILNGRERYDLATAATVVALSSFAT